MNFMEKMVFEFGVEDASISNAWSRFRRRVELDWGDGSVDKVLTVQARVTCIRILFTDKNLLIANCINSPLDILTPGPNMTKYPRGSLVNSVKIGRLK